MDHRQTAIGSRRVGDCHIKLVSRLAWNTEGYRKSYGSRSWKSILHWGLNSNWWEYIFEVMLYIGSRRGLIWWNVVLLFSCRQVRSVWPHALYRNVMFACPSIPSSLNHIRLSINKALPFRPSYPPLAMHTRLCLDFCRSIQLPTIPFPACNKASKPTPIRYDSPFF